MFADISEMFYWGIVYKTFGNNKVSKWELLPDRRKVLTFNNTLYVC